MYRIDFQSPVHVHFIGIGGISMSGLAAILLDRGFSVSGSDRSESDLTKWLTASGAKIFYGQCASNIEDSVDLVVYTAELFLSLLLFFQSLLHRSRMLPDDL